MLQSCYLRNEGNGKFTLIPLPAAAQVSVLNGMIAGDFDGDGNLDVLLNGNDYGTEVSIGRYDALNGLLLKGDGKGGFSPLSILQSGIYIPGDGKALVKLTDSRGNYLVAASQNKGDLKLFECRQKIRALKINADDVSCILYFENGSTQKEEFYYGDGFLSQSARFCSITPHVLRAEITNTRGRHRTIVMTK